VSTGARGLREVLSAPDFRRLLSVRMLGQFADGLFQAALLSSVFFNPERATSAAQAAGAFATLLLPYSIVGPFAGVFLDRWRRQRVLLVGNLVRAAAIVVFAVLLAQSGPTAPPVVALALVVVSANRFILSGLSAALPHVVPERQLVTANSLSTTLGSGAAAAGGATAVALRLVLGEDDLGASRTSLIAALVYVLAGLLAARIAAGLLGPEDPPLQVRLRSALGAVARGVAQGARHVAERGPAARGLGAISAHRFFYGLSFVTTLLLYTEEGAIGLGLPGLGEVVVASVLGGLLAAAVTPGRDPAPGDPDLGHAGLRRGRRGEVAFGLPFTHAFFLVAAFFLGFAAQASKICIDTLLQESVEDDFRGRVFSFYDTLFNVSFVRGRRRVGGAAPAGRQELPGASRSSPAATRDGAVYGLLTARARAHEPPEPVVVRA
jgi:MFS family permease